MEMAVKSMETAVKATTLMDMASGHFPVPVGCRNRDFYPPKFVGGGSRAAELLLENCRFV
jgi:hypothetical protein